jgi:hypothetical protein
MSWFRLIRGRRQARGGGGKDLFHVRWNSHHRALRLGLFCRLQPLQEMDALDVARLMHRLFSAFDAAVVGAGLFKMDTVGDAYVAAGFFPSESSPQPLCMSGCSKNDAAAAKGKACDRVLRAARDMIAVVAACREETGREVHCRIGVSAGEVLAGVLGRLQPRFHIFGAGLSAAERHEKAGKIDAVHASPAFMAALSLAGDLRRDSGKTDEECDMEDACSNRVSSGHQLLAVAEALECVRTGSSGKWNLERSDMVELPATSQATMRLDRSFPSPDVVDAVSNDQAPESDAANIIPLHCCQLEVDQQQHSFFLRPHAADDQDSVWAEPGRRFFAATSASLSHGHSLPQPLWRMSIPTLSGSSLFQNVGRSRSMGSDSEPQGQLGRALRLGNGLVDNDSVALEAKIVVAF